MARAETCVLPTGNVTLDRADRIGVALIAEGKAAEAYWDAWAAVPIQFARRDHVPDHWRTFGARRSPLTLRPRNAANPLNAILNYLYTLLEVETRIALIARGLDPGLALFLPMSRTGKASQPM